MRGSWVTSHEGQGRGGAHRPGHPGAGEMKGGDWGVQAYQRE
jgi:hypothetical protein